MIYKTLMAVVQVVVPVKLNIVPFFSIALLEKLLYAFAIGRGKFKFGNASSFSDLREG